MNQQLSILSGAELATQGLQNAVNKADRDYTDWSEEIWKPVVGYEGSYEVSNFARVRSLDRPKYKCPKRIIKGKIRPQQLLSNGYWSIMLSKEGLNKRVSVHRLVAMAFLPNPYNYATVNHINYDRKDSNVENLEWCSQSQNIKHATQRPGYRNSMQGRTGKLSPHRKPIYQLDLDGNVIKLWDCAVDAAIELKMCYSSLRSCAQGRQNTANNFKWKYA